MFTAPGAVRNQTKSYHNAHIQNHGDHCAWDLVRARCYTLLSPQCFKRISSGTLIDNCSISHLVTLRLMELSVIPQSTQNAYSANDPFALVHQHFHFDW
jgi:hypothetical protein